MKVSIPKGVEREINSPNAIAEVFQAILKTEPEHDQDKEHGWIAGLNGRNAIKYVELVSLGTMSAALVHPREVFRFAVLKGTASIIFCHNHPTGNTEQSKEDEALTRKLFDAGEILGIKLLNHIIIGNGTDSFLSFKGIGLL